MHEKAFCFRDGPTVGGDSPGPLAEYSSRKQLSCGGQYNSNPH